MMKTLTQALTQTLMKMAKHLRRPVRRRPGGNKSNDWDTTATTCFANPMDKGDDGMTKQRKRLLPNFLLHVRGMGSRWDQQHHLHQDHLHQHLQHLHQHLHHEVCDVFFVSESDSNLMHTRIYIFLPPSSFARDGFVLVIPLRCILHFLLVP